ncbi:hypothetical protein HNQ59_003993 [Chitinivorax tropicus]|uniref:Uncharacterized protein n=2 Tax=Chitinivorax tropicus TaxID=714531 RepID=A0A840MPV6_9PROT|nr:hypothetical protein [Chitinivorax tropicus]
MFERYQYKTGLVQYAMPPEFATASGSAGLKYRAVTLSLSEGIGWGGPNTTRTGAFDPALLNAPERVMWPDLGRLESKQGYVSSAGLEKVQTHLDLFGQNEANSLMVQRLQRALDSGTPIEGADLVFYTHELNEATRTGRLAKELNVSPAIVAEQSEAGYAFYNKVHVESLNKYQTSPFSVYHLDVLNANPGDWSSAWFKFWEQRK